MKFRSLVLLTSVFVFLVTASSASAKYSGGTGEPNDPYKIVTAQDLIDLGNEPNDYDKYFIQDANIDLSEYIFDGALIACDINPNKTDFQGTPFAGVFDGNGYTIRNLHIEGNNYLGMFGKIESEAILSNISIEGADIEKGIYFNCINVGGLVGCNYGTIIQSHSTGLVNGDNYCNYIGGLVGRNYGNITLSYSTCTVSGNDYIGGLVGYNSGNITLNYSTGSVNGGNYIGGLAGENSVNITSSYTTCTVSGNYNVGGLVGNNEFNITSSYSTGSVTGNNSYTGGLTGKNNGIIHSSYSIGTVNGHNFSGGLVGSNSGSITSSFWSTQTSEQSTSAGGSGLTTEQMQTKSTYSQWDCIDEKNNGTSDFWYLQEGSYPQLTGLSGYTLRELQGSGTPNDPYLIYDANDLGIIFYHPEAHYRLEADINLSDITWRQPIVPYFDADFDGNWHTIKSLHIDGISYLGLFGKLDSNAEISNLILEDADINGIGKNIGTLAGQNYGVIKSSYSISIVSGISSAGGLVGYNLGSILSSYTIGQINGNSNIGTLAGSNAGSIISCYCSGIATGSFDCGGITGINAGIITSCFSNSTVQICKGRPSQYVGGLVGNNPGSITSSYCIGTVSGNTNINPGGLAGDNSGSIISSFWDIQTSGLSTSKGGIGKTTAEMQDIDTYLNAGWDFVDEQSNGTCDFWCFQEGTYPQLAAFSGYAIQKPEGSGTPESPYLIYDINDLGVIWYYPQAYYSQVKDINLSDTKWKNSIVPLFAGNFNGNHHKIFSLNINGAGHLGFFGLVTRNSEISNISLESGNINGIGDYIGGLIGYNSGDILSSSFTGKVCGRNYTGGLIGYNLSGDINSCFSIGEVIGNDFIGGLVGFLDRELIQENYINSYITSSYSKCMVTGIQNVGGLVGLNYICNIHSSFSSNKVNGQENIGGLLGYSSRVKPKACFWDIETSGLSTSGGGTGKTTAEMQDINTFLNAGWDFIGENDNGTEDIWWIDNGLDYPRLWWEMETE